MRPPSWPGAPCDPVCQVTVHRRVRVAKDGTANSASPRVRPSRTHAASPISTCTSITFSRPVLACSFDVWRATACARGPGAQPRSVGTDLLYSRRSSRWPIAYGRSLSCSQSPCNVPLHEKRRWPVTSSCAIIPAMAIIASRPLFSSLVWSSLNSSALSGLRRNGSKPKSPLS